MPASWSNPTLRLDNWSSILEKAHFSLHLVLTLTLSCEREHLLLTAFYSDWAGVKQSAMLFSMLMPWSCRGARAASTHFMKVLGENARLNRRIRYWYALPLKANLRYSCVEEGWICGSMRRSDPSSQTSPPTWFETRPVWSWASWTWVAWLSSSINADLKSDIALHPSSERWSTDCRTELSVERRDHLDGLLPQVSVSFLFHDQSLLGAHQNVKHPFEKRQTRPKLNLVASFYSVQDPVRHIWQKLPRCQMMY